MATLATEYENEVLPELAGETEFGEIGELGEYEFGELGETGELGELGEYELAGELGEWEQEQETETQAELNPIRRVYPDAVMEHMAHEAVQAETEQEAAEHFLPLIGMAAAKLLPLAAKALPMAAKALPKISSVFNKVAPNLTRGVGQISRTLFRNPGTRPLLRTLPTVAKRTMATVARQAANGINVTPQSAVRALRQNTAAMLRNRPACSHTIQRSRAIDRQLHRAIPIGGGAAVGATCPTCGR
jgi:hypothetical protein